MSIFINAFFFFFVLFFFFVSDKLRLKRLKPESLYVASGMLGTLGATYVACSGGESGSGHFIPHYMGIHVKYLPPKAPSFFPLKPIQNFSHNMKHHCWKNTVGVCKETEIGVNFLVVVRTNFNVKI